MKLQQQHTTEKKKKRITWRVRKKADNNRETSHIRKRLRVETRRSYGCCCDEYTIKAVRHSFHCKCAILRMNDQRQSVHSIHSTWTEPNKRVRTSLITRFKYCQSVEFSNFTREEVNKSNSIFCVKLLFFSVLFFVNNRNVRFYKSVKYSDTICTSKNFTKHFSVKERNGVVMLINNTFDFDQFFFSLSLSSLGQFSPILLNIQWSYTFCGWQSYKVK